MATLKAKSLRDALQKARKVGRVEDAVEIAGCALVFQSLTTSDYEAIAAECAEFDDIAYYHAYQVSHVARAIVEIDGQDLRDVEYIEDEVPDLEHPGATVVRKIERHEWIKSNLIASWGREAVLVAWRKFAELLVKADKRAKDGVTFLVPDETSDDKLRRLLKDVRELEEEMPSELAAKILSDAGFQRKSSVAELESAAKRVNELASQEVQPEVASAPPEVAPPPVQRVVVPAPVPQPVSTPEEAPEEEPRVWRSHGFEEQAAAVAKVAQPLPTADPRELMRNRTPLNQQAEPIPTPSNSQHQTAPISAQKRVAVPAAIRQAAAQNTQDLRVGAVGNTVAAVGEVPEPARPGSRAAQLAALEAQVDPGFERFSEEPSAVEHRPAVAELRSRGGLDPRAIAAITEKPPVAGVNKKFRQPPKL